MEFNKTNTSAKLLKKLTQTEIETKEALFKVLEIATKVPGKKNRRVVNYNGCYFDHRDVWEIEEILAEESQKDEE